MKYFQKSVLKMVCFLLFAIALPGMDANAQDLRGETVVCEFLNSQEVQTCTSEFGHCSGTENCSVFVRGVKDAKIEWESSCGSSSFWKGTAIQKTKINGNDETIQFNCKYVNTVSSKPLYSKLLAVYPSSVDISASSEFEDVVRAKDAPLQSDAHLYFPDTDRFSLEGKAAAYLRGLGIIGGFPDGEFKGDQLVNRAELTKFLLLASSTDVGMLKNRGKFPDVIEGEWYVKYIMKAEEKGIIQGYPDGFFRPARTVNTAESLKMMTKAFVINENITHGYEDVTEHDWFDRYAGIAERYDLFSKRPNKKLQPDTLLTRNEVAVMIYKFLTFYKYENSGDSFIDASSLDFSNGKTIMGESQFVRQERQQEVPTLESELVFKISSQTPPQQKIPTCSEDVLYTKFQVAAEGEDVKLQGVGVHRMGVGDSKYLKYIWLEHEGIKISPKSPISSSTDMVTLWIDSFVTIQSGQMESFDIVADLACEGNIGHHSRLIIKEANDIISTADNVSSSNFPVEGNEVEITEPVENTPSRILRMDTLSNEKVVAGTDEVDVFAFLIENNESEDMNVESISMQSVGTGNSTTFSDFTLKLFIDGVQRGSAEVPNASGEAVFEDISLMIPSMGEENSFYLTMDTVESSAPGTIQFNINDVEAENIEDESSILIFNGSEVLSSENSLEGGVFQLILE